MTTRRFNIQHIASDFRIIDEPDGKYVLYTDYAELEETNRAYKEAWSINILTERIAQLEGLIADLECNGVFCGLDNQLCDNCRIRFEAL